ncbi:uncharacterized protein LOC121729566 [Aricia agestis]|uniref:uncharacterized protein LOC121729566 n=1 Tax=Aricia agestis TaxID=91739 RepID=UPI001C2055BA|nr:uncharacterized protein LOC121729566 [Aricia agestis]
MLVAGLVLDFAAPPERSFRVETSASSLVWIANITNMSLMSAVGILAAPSRIKCIMNVLTAVKKMKKTIGNYSLHNKVRCDGKLRVYCMFLIVANIVLIFGDIFKYTDNAIEYEKDVRVLVLYTAFYYEYLCFTLFACQFIVIASEVHSVMMMITECLEKLLYTVNANRKYTGKLEPVMHDLATVFGECCDLVRDVNDGFGLQLLLVLMNYFLELIVTPYYLMSALYMPAARRDLSYVSLQVVWAVYHLVCLLAVVQPAYSTQLQIEKTEHLVSRYLRHFKPYEPVYSELERFTRQLVFNKPSYSPLGVCTLSRQLCVSVVTFVRHSRDDTNWYLKRER